MKAATPIVLSMMVLLSACATSGNMRTVNLNKASQLNAQLAVRYLEQGDLQQAKIKAEKAIEQDQNNALANNINGTVQQRLGENAKAGEYFKRAVQLAPDQPEYANSYGVYLCEVGRIQDGIEQFVAVAENPLHRTPVLAYENAAICAIKAKQFDVAETHLQNALKIEPGYAKARVGLVELQYKARRYTEALNNIGMLEKVNRLNAGIVAIGVRAAKALNRPDTAEHYVYVLKTRFPDSYQARALAQ